jgi:hypothetical protein
MPDRTNAGLEQLLTAIQQFAADQTNPLLVLLGSDEKFFFDKKYPSDLLTFGGNFWKTYYHIHAENKPFSEEHGHFHIFTRDKNTDLWSHVVALSMDDTGQPINWFCVNHWAVSGEWRNANEICDLLESNLDPGAHSDLLCDWINALLVFYNKDIQKILKERDTVLDQHKGPDLKQNRDIYVLSSKKIELIHDIQNELDMDNINS